MDDALQLARELIQRRSITPDDAGCQALLGQRLEAAGFDVEHVRFGDVDNLWAVAGDSGPLLCLAGHTDIVPPGPEHEWPHPPFGATLEDGWLHGRGAADMKSGVAAIVCAAERFRAAHPEHAGRIGVLLTSDEEGPAIDGTRKMVDWLQSRDTHIDYCVLGEPSSSARPGDTLKVGRRGSLNGRISINGRQGHVAYPQDADNALHALLPLLDELVAHQWDHGDAQFPPTSFQVSNIQAGTGAENVIPGRAEAWFNFRFNALQDPELLQAHVESRCAERGLSHDIDWHLSGRPFITREGVLIDAAVAAIEQTFAITPELSTGGGTSDGRFIAPAGAQVVEFGLLNDTIHQIGERVRADHVGQISSCVERMLEHVLLD